MKLYVGNLPYSTTQEELAEMFKPYGEVASANIITDRMSGKSKGFGFVEMANREDAEKAMKDLNNKSIKNRSIVVNEANPPRPRRSGGGMRGERRGGYDRNNEE